MRTTTLALAALVSLAGALGLGWIAFFEEGASPRASEAMLRAQNASRRAGSDDAADLAATHAAERIAREAEEAEEAEEAQDASTPATNGAVFEAPRASAAELGSESEHLFLRVLDEEGRAVPEEPVRLVWTTRSRQWCSVPWHGTTDAAGRVQIAKGRWWRSYGEVLAAIHRPLFAEPVVLVAEDAWSGREIELRLPRSARWRVRTTDQDGRTVRSERIITIARASSAEGAPPWLVPALVQRHSGSEPASLVVPPGAALHAYVEDASDVHFPGAWIELPPLGLGETRDVELRLGSTKPWVALRLLDESGEPFASAQVLVWCGRIADTWSTDGAGRLRLRIDQPWSPSEARKLRILGFDDRSYFPPRGPAWNDEHQDLAVEVDLSYDIPSGEHDLGTHTLRRPPPLLDGRVVDDRGQPVPFASVRVEHEIAAETTAPPAADGAAEFADLTTLEVDATGRFALRSRSEARRFRLVAVRAELLPGDPLLVARGSRDLELRMQRPAFLAGTVRLPPRERGPGAILYLEMPPPPPEARRLPREERARQRPRPSTTRVATIEDGAFDFGPLQAGRGLVSLVALPSGEVLAELEVELHPGERCSDPRLSPLVPR